MSSSVLEEYSPAITSFQRILLTAAKNSGDGLEKGVLGTGVTGTFSGSVNFFSPQVHFRELTAWMCLPQAWLPLAVFLFALSLGMTPLLALLLLLLQSSLLSSC